MFFPGLHQPSDAQHFERCMVSVKRLHSRVSDFTVRDWILDSGAFTELHDHGHYRQPVEAYARAVRRWAGCGRLLAAVSQDYMTEPFILARTGLTVTEHQRLTIERYDALYGLVPATTIMPVLQGYQPHEYVDHIRQYGERLRPGMWVGVGSVCKRNSDVGAIERVLHAIVTERPDLRLHGFGIKETALESSYVRSCLYSADSMAWSFAARRNGGNANDWREAAAMVTALETQRVRVRGVQLELV